MTEPMSQVAIRLPDALLERVEAHTDRMKEHLPGLKITRADAIRSLIAQALEQAEQPDR